VKKLLCFSIQISIFLSKPVKIKTPITTKEIASILLNKLLGLATHLSFAITFCPPKDISNIIKLKPKQYELKFKIPTAKLLGRIIEIINR